MLRETLKVAVVVVVVCGGMLWWSLGPHIEQRVNQETEQRWGWVVFPPETEHGTALGVTLMPDTAITFDDITISGQVMIDGNDLIPAWSLGPQISWELVVGDLILTISLEGGFFYAIHSAGGPIMGWDAGLLEWDEDGTVTVPFSITASGYHVQRTMSTDPIMKPDNTAPTHSVERLASDVWVVDDDPGTIAVTFGELSWNGVNGVNPDPDYPGETIPVNILPSSFIHPNFEAYWGDTAAGCVTEIVTNLFDYNFDAVDITSGVNPTIRLRGSGKTLTWGYVSGTFGQQGIGVTYSPPFVADWSNLGLCDWGETEHNSAYDDVLVWGGFTKTAALDGEITWPDGYDYGDSCPVKLGELRALGQYVQRVAPVTAGGVSVPANWYEFWHHQIYLTVDSASARAHNIYPPTAHPHRIVFGVHGLTETDMTADPHFDIGATRHNVDADTPANATGRPSAWTSSDFVVTGGEVESTGNVTFTVGAGGGVLERSLVDNWLPRTQALIAYAQATGSWDVVPICYMIQRANQFREDWPEYASIEGVWDEPDEDVHYYSAHRYLVFDVSGPALGTVPITVRLSYRLETVTDDHVLDLRETPGQPGQRGVETSLATATLLSLEGEYDSTAGTITVDLAQAPDALPELKHVSKVEVIFEAAHAGAWTLSGMELQSTNAKTTFHEQHLAYQSGGLRGVVNGVYPYSLCTSGNFKVYAGQEEVVEAIDWITTVTKLLSQDGSYAIGLEDYLKCASACTEGWQFDLPANWTALRIDADAAVLTPGYSFDIAERQDIEATTSIPGRFACRKWGIAQSIPYAPWGVLCVQGGLHGLSEDKSASSGIEIFRRANDEDDWVLLRNLGTDADGYWATGEDIVESYDELTPNFWRYKTDDNDFARLYERQWQAAYAIIEQRREPDLAEDGMGRMVVAYLEDGAVWAARIDSLWRGTEPPVLIAKSATAVAPAIELLPDGVMVVTFTDDAGSYAYASTDGGSTWGQIA